MSSDSDSENYDNLSSHDSNDDDDTDELGPYDVICGRNKAAFNNIGNRRFRVTISLNKALYVNAPTRQEKTEIVRSIVHIVHRSGGRFLQRQQQGGSQQWVELTPRKAMAKVGHAVRDMVEADLCRATRTKPKSMSQTVAAATNQSSPLDGGSVPMPTDPFSDYVPEPWDLGTTTKERFTTSAPPRRESFDSYMLSWLGNGSGDFFKDIATRAV